MYAIYSFTFPMKSMERPLMYDTWAPFHQFYSPVYECSVIFQVTVSYFCLVTYIEQTNVMFKLIVFGSMMFEMLQNDISSIFSEYYSIETRLVVFIYSYFLIHIVIMLLCGKFSSHYSFHENSEINLSMEDEKKLNQKMEQLIKWHLAAIWYVWLIDNWLII